MLKLKSTIMLRKTFKIMINPKFLVSIILSGILRVIGWDMQIMAGSQ